MTRDHNSFCNFSRWQPPLRANGNQKYWISWAILEDEEFEGFEMDDLNNTRTTMNIVQAQNDTDLPINIENSWSREDSDFK